MAIGTAVQKGSSVYIYDANGRQTGSVSCSGSDQFMGFTGAAVSIKKGSAIYMYDENGRQTGSVSAS
jgi:hypothetical protein